MIRSAKKLSFDYAPAQKKCKKIFYREQRFSLGAISKNNSQNDRRQRASTRASRSLHPLHNFFTGL
jgi:hypothetical protein